MMDPILYKIFFGFKRAECMFQLYGNGGLAINVVMNLKAYFSDVHVSRYVLVMVFYFAFIWRIQDMVVS